MQCRSFFDNVNELLLRLKYALKVIFKKKYDVKKLHSTAKIALFVTKASVSEGNIFSLLMKYLQTRGPNG